MENAIKLYNELIDLDFMDYSDTKESDLDYLKGLIDTIGYKAAYKLLSE